MTQHPERPTPELIHELLVEHGEVVFEPGLPGHENAFVLPVPEAERQGLIDRVRELGSSATNSAGRITGADTLFADHPVSLN